MLRDTLPSGLGNNKMERAFHRGHRTTRMSDAKQFYSTNEVADLHPVCTRTVHRRIKGGDIKAIKFGNLVRIPSKSLQKYLAAT